MAEALLAWKCLPPPPAAMLNGYDAQLMGYYDDDGNKEIDYPRRIGLFYSDAGCELAGE